MQNFSKDLSVNRCTFLGTNDVSTFKWKYELANYITIITDISPLTVKSDNLIAKII